MQQVLVARHERLREPGPVGVAVEVDAAEPQRPQDGGEVVGRVGRREEVGGARGARVLALDLARAGGDDRSGTPDPDVRPVKP